MSDITVIGLGKMGSALARAMKRAGHDLTVWNRSPAKMQPFVDDGVAEEMLNGELEYRKGNYDAAFAHLDASF